MAMEFAGEIKKVKRDPVGFVGRNGALQHPRVERNALDETEFPLIVESIQHRLGKLSPPFVG